MRRKLFLAVGLLGGLLALSAAAPRASAAVWVGGVRYYGPVYRPVPVVVRPYPVVVRPYPVIYTPAPIIVRPAPVFYGGVIIR